MNLIKSRNKIGELIGKIIKRSSIYESEPWGYKDNMPYLNQLILVGTDLNCDVVLRECQKIEAELGRIRTKKQYEARTIDIDILFYDNDIIQREYLQVPHLRITERRFVLEPLCEINKNYVHPVTGKTAEQHLHECKDTCWVKRFK